MLDSTTVQSVAKATEATAETSGKAIDLARDLGRIVKGPITQTIGMLEDRLKYARFERRIALSEKAQRIMEQRGLSAPTRDLPLKFGVPLLQNAFLEEDDDLQETWARLLVNAGDDSNPMELRVAYISILKELTSFDVRNLNHIAKASIEAEPDAFPLLVETWNLPNSARVRNPLDVSNESAISPEIGISLNNLSRLGCIAPVVGFGGGISNRMVFLTELGRAFYLACS